LHGAAAEVKNMAELKAKQRKSMNEDLFAYVDKDDERHCRSTTRPTSVTPWPDGTRRSSKPGEERGRAPEDRPAAKKHKIDLSKDDRVAKPRSRPTAA